MSASSRKPGIPTDGFETDAARRAVIEALAGRLLSGLSATAVLEAWCSEREWPGASLLARCVPGSDRPLLGERPFDLTPGESVSHRRVRLSWGEHALSEADNWYVPARLTPEMNRLLASTQEPFGRVVHPLAPTRRNGAVRMLWSGGALKAGDGLFALSAVLSMPDGLPFCEVHETYLAALVLAH